MTRVKEVVGLYHFYKGDNFCDFLFVFLYTKPVLKGVYSKRKEFALKFFPFSVDPFPEGR